LSREHEKGKRLRKKKKLNQRINPLEGTEGSRGKGTSLRSYPGTFMNIRGKRSWIGKRLKEVDWGKEQDFGLQGKEGKH